MYAVFGSNGYLGRHFVSLCNERGVAVSGFDVQPDSLLSVSSYRECDVRSSDFWKQFKPELFSSIYFFSGLSGVEASFQNPERFFEINVGGLVNLLKRLVDCPGRARPKVVFPSSRLVYEGGRMVTEKSPVAPRSIYAATKLSCESLLQAYHARHSIDYVSLRICVPFGNLISKDYSYGTLGFFKKKLNSNQPITLYGTGNYLRTFTHIQDLCEVLMLSSGSIASGIYNVGGCDYTLREVAEMLVAEYGGGIEYVEWPKEAECVEMGDISLDAGKLANGIGFKVYKDIKDCIAET